MASGVSRSLEIPAPQESVWDAIEDPLRLGEWLGGRVEIDLRPGGEVSFEDEAGHRAGLVVEVDPPRRLGLWWQAGNGRGGTAVRIEIEPTAGGSRVTVTEHKADLVDVGTESTGRRVAGFRPAG